MHDVAVKMHDVAVKMHDGAVKIFDVAVVHFAYARVVAGGGICRRGRIRPRAREKKQETSVCKGCGRRKHPQKRADQTPGQREKARNLRMQELWQADASAEEGGSAPGPEEKARKMKVSGVRL